MKHNNSNNPYSPYSEDSLGNKRNFELSNRNALLLIFVTVIGVSWEIFDDSRTYKFNTRHESITETIEPIIELPVHIIEEPTQHDGE